MGKAGNELVIIFCKSEETMDLPDVFWYLPISYNAYLGRVGSKTNCTDDMDQLLYLMLKERTFRYFGV